MTDANTFDLGDSAFRSVLEAAPDGIVIVDRTGAIVLVNSQVEQLFGYRRSELVSRGIELLVPERYHEIHRSHRSRYIATPAPRPMGIGLELFGRRKDGSEFPVEISLSPMDVGGDRFIISIIRNVTERKRADAERIELLAQARSAQVAAEQAAAEVRQLQGISDAALAHLALSDLLQELLERVRVAMEIDTAAILLLDPAGEILERRAASGFEANLRDVAPVPLGQGFAGRVAAERRAIALADLDDVVLVNAVLRDRGIRSMLGVPLVAKGRLLGVAHVGTLKRREFTTQDENFLQLVADRAALAIENSLLYQQAQQAAQVREAFLSMAAHELRTPLTTVMGWAAMLADAARNPERDPEALASFVEELQSQVQRLDTLINDLLDASRLQQQRTELRPEEIDLAALIQHVLVRFEHASELQSAHRIVFESSDSVVGYWDPGRMEQVVTNLISNALKYSPDGGEVRTAVTDEGNRVTLSIQDQGIGVGPEDLAHLFEPFRRTDTARRTAGGTGLGLYITRQLVEQHGGTIEMASVVGDGTTVTVRLPRVARATDHS